MTAGERDHWMTQNKGRAAVLVDLAVCAHGVDGLLPVGLAAARSALLHLAAARSPRHLRGAKLWQSMAARMVSVALL